ncbi:MAG: UDP-N-acetylglucosamine 4,6-dehydratase [Treponema sp.]|jgi:FlaA1/EpsC-like NDP-sugar epimerase|nr:UDP-N-acetylglucosamine 4,6-dehydratase [Treponema sp.]
MPDILPLIGRSEPLFTSDIFAHEEELSRIVAASRFLVIGGAGSIGSAVAREIFRRGPRLLHVVDISENNLVELVRDIRSSLGYIEGEFATFALDCGSDIFDAFMSNGPGYDYVLNLSALKHVRSEKDPFTLMRMIDVNIFNTDKTMAQAKEKGAQKYFCVSTDKAANPVNMMGASKRIMEMFLMRRSLDLTVSTARFANVAFSDGSLLYGFNRRMEKEQPLAAPNDVRRYFVTPQESGELCLMSCLLGENRDIFFPKLNDAINLITFSEIAEKYLGRRGYEPVQCATEDEARQRVGELKKKNKYPVCFFQSDTTGEKDFEEFYTAGETPDMDRFESMGVIKNGAGHDDQKLEYFVKTIRDLRAKNTWSRKDLIDIFNLMIPEFQHKETGKFLDGKM